jgi:hypothetical protein
MIVCIPKKLPEFVIMILLSEPIMESKFSVMGLVSLKTKVSENQSSSERMSSFAKSPEILKNVDNSNEIGSNDIKHERKVI